MPRSRQRNLENLGMGARIHARDIVRAGAGRKEEGSPDVGAGRSWTSGWPTRRPMRNPESPTMRGLFGNGR